jgi:hypothetical protein
MRSEARRKLKERMDEARGEDLQDVISEEGSRASHQIERYKRMREGVGQQFQDRRRRSYDRQPQSLADEQGPGEGLDQSGRGERRGWRKQQQREFRGNQDFSAQQEDRRNRKRSRENGPCGESDQQGCGSGQ